MTWSRASVLCLVALAMTAPGLASQDSSDERVEEALFALPESLREGAAVVEFKDGERVDLRKGTNGMICRADDREVPGIAIWCYPQSHDAYARRWYQLEAEGNAPADVDAKVAEEIEAGKLEWPDAAVNYNLVGRSLDTAMPLTVVYVPFATGDSLGIPEERDYHRPWLMRAGTAFAHIMIAGK